jgi:hypothetical protein
MCKKAINNRTFKHSVTVLKQRQNRAVGPLFSNAASTLAPVKKRSKLYIQTFLQGSSLSKRRFKLRKVVHKRHKKIRRKAYRRHTVRKIKASRHARRKLKRRLLKTRFLKRNKRHRPSFLQLQRNVIKKQKHPLSHKLRVDTLKALSTTKNRFYKRCYLRRTMRRIRLQRRKLPLRLTLPLRGPALHAGGGQKRLKP